MRECEKKCQEAEWLAKRQVQKLDRVIQENIQIKNEKWSLEEQEKFSELTEQHFIKIENELDKASNRVDGLQNWLDIFMPLRMQHQITETIKECLPKRGKYILAMVDKQMCEQLRERIFADTKTHGDLQARCLDVIAELKLEAEILEEKNNKLIDEVKERWNQEEPASRNSQSGVPSELAQIGTQVDQFDEEAVEQMKKEIFNVIENKNFETEKKLTNRFGNEIENCVKKTKKVEDKLVSLESEHQTFQHAIKGEIEQYTESQRNQNLETLELLKKTTTTLKKLKGESTSLR